MVYINNISPQFAEPGDRFTMVIKGDAFTGAQGVDVGGGIEVLRFKIVDDGIIHVRLQISNEAHSGTRDIGITDNLGNKSGLLTAGFEVV